jgi:hypothetical protein
MVETPSETTETKGDILEESADKGKDPRSRHWIAGLSIALAIMVLFTGWALHGWAEEKNKEVAQKDKQVKAGATVVSNVRAACADPALKKQLEEVVSGACASADKAAKAIDEPSPGAKGDPGEQGDQGPPPTASQVLAAVSTYCAKGACAPKGPTQAQVNAAVTAYCSGGVCNGEPGSDATGVPGPEGAQGPPPSDEQIAAAVATYCANGNCRGKDGEDGAKGDKGDPGDDARPFEFTFTVGLQTYNVVCEKGQQECTVTEGIGGDPQPSETP